MFKSNAIFHNELLLLVVFYSLWICHTSISKWSFTAVWVAANLLWSLDILTDLSNAVVRKVSIFPLISGSFSILSSLLGDRSESTNFNWYRIDSHVPHPFYSLVRSKYLSIFLLSFISLCGSPEGKIHKMEKILFFFLLINTQSDLLVLIRGSVSI